MSVRSRPHRNLIKLIVILGIVTGAVGALYAPILSTQIADDIEARFRGQVSINQAGLSIIGPRLTLRGVIIDNPDGFTRSQAIEIQKVVIELDGYGDEPVHIRTITFDGVTAYPEFRDARDNLGETQRKLAVRNRMMPQGIWAKPAVIDVIQIRNAKLETDEHILQLEDKNLDPVGSISRPVMLDTAMVKVLVDMIQEERGALPRMTLEGLRKKAMNVIDALGDKLEQMSQ